MPVLTGICEIGLGGQVEYFNYSLPGKKETISGTYYTYEFENHVGSNPCPHIIR